MTDPLGQSQVIPYLSGLVKAGHSIWLISFEKKERFEKNNIRIKALLEQAGIKWNPCMYTSSPPVLSTLKDVRVMHKLAEQIALREGIHAIHCRSYISALAGMRLKKKRGLKFIFDMRGFWADERVDGNIWDLKNPLFNWIYRFFKKKEKEFLLSADAVISLTQNAADEIHSWKGMEKVPITVIPCCTELSHFSPLRFTELEKQQKRKELNIPEGAKILTYLGSLGTWYMLPEMLLLYKEILVKHPSMYFLFITADSPEMVFSEAHKISLKSNQIRVIEASRAEVPLLASLSDVSVFFIRQAFSKKASSPTKMGELMALGIPLICNTGVGDVDKILNQSANGLLISSFQKESYVEVANQMEQLMHSNPQRSIEGAQEWYSLETGVNRYNAVYQQLAQSL